MTRTATPVRRTPTGKRDAVNEALIRALLGGSTWPEAAEQAGCSRATVARRMADPEFRGELTRRQADARNEVERRLVAVATSAVDTLTTILSDDSQPAAARVMAARTVLDRVVPVDRQTVAVQVNTGPLTYGRGSALSEQLAALAERMGVDEPRGRVIELAPKSPSNGSAS